VLRYVSAFVWELTLVVLVQLHRYGDLTNFKFQMYFLNGFVSSVELLVYSLDSKIVATFFFEMNCINF
jgi:hypothetical protein